MQCNTVKSQPTQPFPFLPGTFVSQVMSQARPVGYSVLSTYILMPHRQVIKVCVQKFYNLIFFASLAGCSVVEVCVSVDGCESCASEQSEQSEHHRNVTHLQPWPFLATLALTSLSSSYCSRPQSHTSHHFN